jgi:hypothetical protein
MKTTGQILAKQHYDRAGGMTDKNGFNCKTILAAEIDAAITEEHDKLKTSNDALMAICKNMLALLTSRGIGDKTIAAIEAEIEEAIC